MKAPNMKKTPSALKWLAEKRARVAGELEACKQSLVALNVEAPYLRRRLAQAEVLLAAAAARQERLTVELDALDKTVILYDAAIRPQDIEPIHAWQGNYGKRGTLRVINRVNQGKFSFAFALQLLAAMGVSQLEVPRRTPLTGQTGGTRPRRLPAPPEKPAR